MDSSGIAVKNAAGKLELARDDVAGSLENRLGRVLP